MKYYLIAGEASGDLHASHLMRALQRKDREAEFRFFGGDNMIAVGGTCACHYRDIAYMGFIPVLLHLPVILRAMHFCKQDIEDFQPDVVIPVDYAGFNLKICRHLRKVAMAGGIAPKVIYYISPKIWAWKEHRIKAFKRDVDEMMCILPFEVEFFTKKHGYPVHYVGNPTSGEVREFLRGYNETKQQFAEANGICPDKPIVALLAGSRMQEIKDNLPMMLRVADKMRREHNGCLEFVIAAAPSVSPDVYSRYVGESDVHVVHGKTYPLLAHASAALVTSGTATLETACFSVPQVVCYMTPLPRLFRWAFQILVKCKFISLVNLIAGREVVPELFADRFTFDNIYSALSTILPGGCNREVMLHDYKLVHERLGDMDAADNAAAVVIDMAR